MFLPFNVGLFKYYCLSQRLTNQIYRHRNFFIKGEGLYNRGGGVNHMESVTPPENWKGMNFGEKLIWLYEKQREIDDQLRKTL